jgi:hypothetical protein
MRCEPVQRVLESLGAPYALIGAHAMAARRYPRFTVDIDLLTTDRRVLDRAVWAGLASSPRSPDRPPGAERDLRSLRTATSARSGA